MFNPHLARVVNRSSVPASVSCQASDPSAARLCQCYPDALCPPGWTMYVDDGSEGHASCIGYSTSVVNFFTAQSACAAGGSHLATITSSSNSSKLPTLLKSWGRSYLANRFWVGCRQSYAQPFKNFAWYWIDGTSNVNLYNGVNGSTGTGLWGTPGQPE